ncbi:HD domain-containing protein [Sphaerobacter sp.]|uniref:3'-5' exoribonuclease YhaM family protein n=1 Tax=Sphaerobacter sp. TaxID=2099654 RepID=UPI001D89CEAE|nr:HD domain-containing protein [Sphaerobacter sp.]MBX5443948.1 HD domain-containing protein [Sphaerobacter sp.]
MQHHALDFATLVVGQVVEGIALAFRVERRHKRGGEPFLEFRLRDKQLREVRAVKWDVVDGEEYTCPTLLYVAATVKEYQGKRELHVTECEVCNGDIAPYLPGPYRNDNLAEFWDLVDTLRDRSLTALLERAVETFSDFLTSPASAKYHGAYREGLLEHSVNVARICDAAASLYAGAVDRDLLIAGALLHDIGKAGLHPVHAPDQVHPDERLFGHVLRGVRMVEDLLAMADDIDDERQAGLLHLIASHHGQPEWGAAVRPATIEAWILHHADQLDACVTGARDLLRAANPDDGWVWFPMRESLLRVPATNASSHPDGPERWDPFLNSRDDPEDVPF